MAASENVLSIESDALTQIVAIRDNEPGDTEFALLMEVSGVNGLQFSYDLSFVPLEDATDDDIVEAHGDLSVILRRQDLEKLSGATLKIGAQGLAIDNPNTPPSPFADLVPGTLEGPLADQVKIFIDQAINPGIAAHGGATRLVSVDDENQVYLEMMGGCQGCGMAAVTLKQGIERMILEQIPEVSAVIDVTDHAQGTNPYYEGAHHH